MTSHSKDLDRVYYTSKVYYCVFTTSITKPKENKEIATSGRGQFYFGL